MLCRCLKIGGKSVLLFIASFLFISVAVLSILICQHLCVSNLLHVWESWATPMNLVTEPAGAVVMGYDDSVTDLDPTEEHMLKTGKTNIMISFPRDYLINEFSFFNFTAKGTVQVYTSSMGLEVESSRWEQATDPVTFNELGSVVASIPYINTTYVKVVYDVEESGRIGSFAIIGEPKISQFTARFSDEDARQQTKLNATNRQSDPTKTSANMALANLGGEILYASSGEHLKYIHNIDYQPTTNFTFAPNDNNPIIVLRIAKTTELYRAGILMNGPPCNVDMYILRDLPDGLHF